MFALCGIGLAACGDDEAYDVYGDPFNRVYIQGGSNTYKIVQTLLVQSAIWILNGRQNARRKQTVPLKW